MITPQQAHSIPARAAASGCRTLGRHITYLPRTSSTQDYLLEMARDAKDGTVIVARRQYRGRGRMGRRWSSPPGSLTFSVLLRDPPIPPDACGIIMMASAVSLHHSLEAGGIPSKIKWPNDIMVRGRKAAGILLDIDMQDDNILHAIVGVGVNVSCDTQQISREVAAPIHFGGAESLHRHNRHISGLDILVSFLKHLEGSLYRGADTLAKHYAARCSTIGGMVSMNGITGVAQGVAPDGALLIRHKGRLRRVISPPAPPDT